ncbi:hypothetical protein R1521_09730 [Rhizobium brockwellii]|uniref:Uncharacterized protein n=1 Tax=Rhizobium brockwellii TaxID=3019932 RepID=A0ABU3YIT3_9HYPH|nr:MULTISPECIES: hypothetical protein [Rhizobium]MDV4178783.1 hypothetical protein [Rhizobium brockwellii]MDV4185781.1 hypothetical protein [Rhizobium brockwellii]
MSLTGLEINNQQGASRTMWEEHLWRQWRAWFPVMPIDNGMFGLEAAWR